MKTKNPHTELLYSLSPSKNVTESLKTFGINEESTKAIAIRFYESGAFCSLETNLKDALNCKIIDFSDEALVYDCDFEAVKLIYKPTTSDRIIGEICTIISTKNI